MALKQSSAISKVKKGIIPVSDATPYVRALLYGRNGKGKTRIAASGPPDTLMIDVNEEGTKSIQSYPDCYVYQVKRWEEVTWLYWMLREGDHTYKTVAIDTVTQLQKLCIRHVLDEAEDRDPNRPASTPDRRVYGAVAELMRPIIYDYRNLPMNVVFVCQEKIDKGSDDEEASGEVRPRIVPDLTPSIRGDVMSAVEIIGRVYKRPVRVGKGKKEETKWETRMLVGDHEDYETKNRTGDNLPRVIRNPTMGMLIEASNPREDD